MLVIHDWRIQVMEVYPVRFAIFALLLLAVPVLAQEPENLAGVAPAGEEVITAPAGWGGTDNQPVDIVAPLPAPPPAPPTVQHYTAPPSQVWNYPKTRIIGQKLRNWSYRISGQTVDVVYEADIPPGQTAGDVEDARMRARGITIDWSKWVPPPTSPRGYSPLFSVPTAWQHLWKIVGDVNGRYTLERVR